VNFSNRSARRALARTGDVVNTHQRALELVSSELGSLKARVKTLSEDLVHARSAHHDLVNRTYAFERLSWRGRLRWLFGVKKRVPPPTPAPGDILEYPAVAPGSTLKRYRREVAGVLVHSDHYDGPYTPVVITDDQLP